MLQQAGWVSYNLVGTSPVKNYFYVHFDCKSGAPEKVYTYASEDIINELICYDCGMQLLSPPVNDFFSYITEETNYKIF